MTREDTFQQILSQIKKHLTNIEGYYADKDYDKTSLVVSAVRREQENVVSLTRQLMSYEDLLQRACGTDKDDDDIGYWEDAPTVKAKAMDGKTELTIAGEDDPLPF